MAEDLGYQYDVSEMMTSIDDTDFIGAGSYGRVYKVLHDPKLGLVAVKVFSLTGSEDLQKSKIEDVKKELRSLRFQSHKNILRCHGWLQWSTYIGVVVDYMPGGNLDSLLHARTWQEPIPFNLKCRILHDVSKAMKFLHKGKNDQRLKHGDIKPLNIFLTKYFEAVLGDFGSAEIGTKTSDRTQEQGVHLQHTLRYSAPEVLTMISKSDLGTATDIYSFGIVIHEVLSENRPFQSVTNRNLFHEVHTQQRRPSENECLPPSDSEDYNQAQILCEVMKNCWGGDAGQRWRAYQVEQRLANVMSQYSERELADSVYSIHRVVNFGSSLLPNTPRVSLNRKHMA